MDLDKKDGSLGLSVTVSFSPLSFKLLLLLLKWVFGLFLGYYPIFQGVVSRLFHATVS